jgi:hypothetical protein
MVVEPKTAEESRVHITVPRSLLRKLEAARDALSHSHPGASEAEILEAGLDLLLARAAKRRGIVENPRKKRPSDAPAPEPVTSPSTEPRSRYVPADVRRAIWKRDQGKCQWPVDGGGICGATYQVELDHIEGFALGAETTIEACRLLCRPHQDLSARRLYGDELMDNYTRPKGGGCSEPVEPYFTAVGSATAGSGSGMNDASLAHRSVSSICSSVRMPESRTSRTSDRMFVSRR